MRRHVARKVRFYMKAIICHERSYQYYLKPIARIKLVHNLEKFSNMVFLKRTVGYRFNNQELIKWYNFTNSLILKMMFYLQNIKNVDNISLNRMQCLEASNIFFNSTLCTVEHPEHLVQLMQGIIAILMEPINGTISIKYTERGMETNANQGICRRSKIKYLTYNECALIWSLISIMHQTVTELAYFSKLGVNYDCY